MMRQRIPLGAFALLLAGSAFLSACGGGGGGGGASTATLSVTGEPANARVFLNGQLVRNPQNIVLPPGVSTIRVETTLGDGQVIAQQFTVTAGAVGSIQYNLNRYRVETNPATVEVWVSDAVTVTAILRDTQSDSVISADFVWSVQDTNIATVQRLSGGSARVVGVRQGRTRLVIADMRTGVVFETPILVRDFPPPPGG